MRHGRRLRAGRGWRYAALSPLLPILATAASAASLVNRDARDFKVTIVERDATKDYVLAPGMTLDGICPKDCIVRLDGGERDEYRLEALEAASIEDGKLYHDGPSVSQEPPGRADGASPPAARTP